MALKPDGECPWQQLVDTAYDRWQKHNNEARSVGGEMWDFADMLGSCSESERVACVLGKLNQQIDNGGVSQWIENGYARDTRQILAKIMPNIGDTSRLIWDHLSNFLEKWTDDNSEPHGCAKTLHDDGLLRLTDREAAKYELAESKVTKLFYALQDSWHSEVYSYIARLRQAA